LIFGHSFFDKQLLNRNFKISRGRTEILLSERLVINLTGNNKYLSVPPKVSKEELMEMFQSSGFTEAYIVENKKLIAKLRVNDLLNFQTGEIIGDKNPLTLNSNLSVSESIEKASNFVGESLPVVDNENNLLGVVTESDLFKEYLSTQTKISNIEKD
jgi:CIC family chloride channel protein